MKTTTLIIIYVVIVLAFAIPVYFMKDGRVDAITWIGIAIAVFLIALVIELIRKNRGSL